jgi:MFS family permease
LRSFWKVIKENSVVYASYLLRHTGAHAIWIVFPLFLIEKLGASLLWVGVLMALNTGSQFFFMGLIGRTAEPDEGRRLLRLGLLLSTVVFVSYYFSSYYLQLVPVQLLLGVAWSSLYVGSLLHLVEKNVERATSTGALGSTISLATMIGPFLGGLISEIFGMRAVFLVASALTLAGLVLSKRMTN